MGTTSLQCRASNFHVSWRTGQGGGAQSYITDEFFERMFEGQSCLCNKQPSTVCFLFARKVAAPSALEPLLDLPTKVLGLLKQTWPVQMHVCIHFTVISTIPQL